MNDISQHSPLTAWRKRRDRALHSITGLLTRWKISPNHITFMSVLLLLAAALLPAAAMWPHVVILLLLYCLLDGLDGSLARRQGRTHEGGAILDTAADHAGIPLLAAAAVYHLQADPVTAILFSSGYLTALMLSLYGDDKGVRIWPLLRMKYVFYTLYGLSAALNADWVTLLALLGAVYYAAFTIQALTKIYFHFENRGRRETLRK